MSEKITKFTNKVSPLIEGQVPDFVQSDHPVFVNFVKDYFEFLEAGRLTLTNVVNYVSLETNTVNFILDEDGERVVTEIGEGNLRIYSLSGLTRIYLNSLAGTVDYVNGKITLGSINITAISFVDGTLSTKIRVTVIPSSYDIVPVRNQILELDLVNTTITGSVDAAATTGLGYTTTQTGSTSTTTVSTTSSTPSSSAYW